MKILFLSHRFYPDIGGIEVNSDILANAFLKGGHQIKLVTWTEAAGDKTYPFIVVRNPNLITLLKAHKWADVVFENNPSLRLAWPSFFTRKPFIVALCTWISRSDGKTAWQDKIKTLWLKKAKAVIAVSQAVQKKCWPPAIVISNPYNPRLFRKLPDVKKTRDFVFLGRLVSDKGADMTIKAMSILINKASSEKLNRNFSLTIIGDGPESAALQKMVVDMDIQSNISFTGSLKGEELVTCLNLHRFMLVPSVWEEPFGNVALEGMACGCVPIVSDGGGLLDAIGNAGLSFSRGNVESLVNCLWRIMNDGELESELIAAAPSHLRAHHPDIIAQRYLTVITQ